MHFGRHEPTTDDARCVRVAHIDAPLAGAAEVRTLRAYRKEVRVPFSHDAR